MLPKTDIILTAPGVSAGRNYHTLFFFPGALYDATRNFVVPFFIFAAFFFVGFLAMLSTPVLKKIEPGVAMETDLVSGNHSEE